MAMYVAKSYLRPYPACVPAATGLSELQNALLRDLTSGIACELVVGSMR